MKKFVLFFALLSFTSLTQAGEQSVYDFSWLDADKEVYVLQNRKFRKRDHLYISVAGGMTVSGSFTDGYLGQVRAGYFFREDWGLEVLFSKNNLSTNDTFGAVADAGVVAYYRAVESYQGAMLWWSPFYSKINTFNQVIYYDWMFGLGYAQINDKNNKTSVDTNTTTSELTTESHTGFMWGSSMRFYFTQSWSARLDFTAVHYQAPQFYKPSTGSSYEKENWFNNFDLTVGLTYAF